MGNAAPESNRLQRRESDRSRPNVGGEVGRGSGARPGEAESMSLLQ